MSPVESLLSLSCITQISLLSSTLPDLKMSGQSPCLFIFLEKGIFSSWTEKSEKGDLNISSRVQITAVILLGWHVKCWESVTWHGCRLTARQKQRCELDQSTEMRCKAGTGTCSGKQSVPKGLRWRGNLAQQRIPCNRWVQLVDWCHGIQEFKKLAVICPQGAESQPLTRAQR